MLSPEQQRQALSILEGALEHAPGDRRAWVNQQCAGDSDLEQQVFKLIAAEQQTPTAAMRTGHFVPSQSITAPERVGHYRIIEQLGAGGMGVVYRGERDDGTFTRTVAIKFIHELGVGSEVVTRFHSERQILARMQHPNIAQMLDGGDVDGRPYLVMEFIEGAPFGYDRAISRNEQLRRFCSVCDALSYAHSQLVLHRDIKPGNILVTQEGEPKLLDFGIAKINTELSAAEPNLTGAMGMPVTPNYCPPEYLAGAGASIAGEVYSLGVLLHELLLGKTPHELSGLSLPEAFRKVSAHSGEPESCGDRDLDLILGRALHVDPQRRYPSVEALRSDIDNWLSNRPISARRDELSYTARQFVKRNKALVFAGVASLTLLLGAAITTALAYLESESSRAVAEQQTQTTQQVLEFFLTAMSSANPIANAESSADSSPTIAQALQFAETNIEERFAEEPELLSIIQSTIANIYTSLGETNKALGYAELVDARLNDGLIDSEYWRLRVRQDLANVYSAGNRYKDAIEHARLLDAALQAMPEPPWYSVADNLSVLALALQTDGQIDASIAVQQKILSLSESHPEIPAIARAKAENGLATSYYNRQQLALAEQHIARAIALMAEAGLGETVNGLRTRHNHATLLAELGRFEDAKQIFAQSIPRLEETLGSGHPMFVWDLTNYGRVYQMAEQPEQLVALMEPYLSLIDAQRPADDEASSYFISKLGHAMCDSGRPAEGLALAQRVVDSTATIYPPGHPFIAEAHVLVGSCLAKLGRLHAAEQAMDRGTQLYLSSWGPKHKATIKAQRSLERIRSKLANPQG